MMEFIYIQFDYQGQLFSCYADKCNITKNLSSLSPGILAEASKTLGIP